MDTKSISYSKWKYQYHIVFISKYRKKQLYGRIREGVKEILKPLCEYKSVEMVEGAVYADHVHMCVCIPPKLSISSFMGYLKGKSALMVYDWHSELQKNGTKHFGPEDTMWQQ